MTINYKDKSDRAIELRIFEIRYGSLGSDKDMLRRWRAGGFNYCSNPAAMWPLMNHCRIDIKRDSCQAHISSYFNPEFVISCRNDEAEILRAAAICYLTMKVGE